ncbi:MAG: cellulase family glycosylhydrolase [Planctomycetales bacterium]|nr:cellulase family glycosylhydrolase [Planctomycetales bacterium]
MTSSLATGEEPKLERIQVVENGEGFQTHSGKRFVPWGFNYDHDGDGRLLEDYWDSDWTKVETAFREMKSMGATVVRIHLQFGKVMESPTRPRAASLDKIRALLRLAEQTGLYLDLTGLGCYHKQDVPEWYDSLPEPRRWAAQASFWSHVAQTCQSSPAVFCYDLMNEPVAPGGDKRRDDWLGPGFGDKHFVQFIGLERKDRVRTEIAREWIGQLVAAIRQHDSKRLITVGLVPWSLERPGITSGFVPSRVAEKLDFIAVHIYPEGGKLEEALKTAADFRVPGKPLVVEEIFPLKCSPRELEEFMRRARPHVAGWIGFYWGQTPAELSQQKTIGAAITREWLEMFQRMTPEMLSTRVDSK